MDSTPSEPRHEATWLSTFAAQLATTQAIADHGGNVGVAFLGDSITHNWTWCGDSWNRVWRPRRCLNYGISGDQTAHLLFRLQHGLLDRIAPAAVVQLIGLNNCWNSPKPETVVAGIGACLARIRAVQPATRVLCLAILPVRGPAAYVAPITSAVNQRLPAIAAQHDCDFRDLGSLFRSNPDGTVPIDVMPDGGHLSPEGYALFTNAVLEWMHT